MATNIEQLHAEISTTLARLNTMTVNNLYFDTLAKHLVTLKELLALYTTPATAPGLIDTDRQRVERVALGLYTYYLPQNSKDEAAKEAFRCAEQFERVAREWREKDRTDAGKKKSDGNPLP